VTLSVSVLSAVMWVKYVEMKNLNKKTENIKKMKWNNYCINVSVPKRWFRSGFNRMLRQMDATIIERDRWH